MAFKEQLREQTTDTAIKTVGLLTVLAVLSGSVGYLLVGSGGLVVGAFIVAVVAVVGLQLPETVIMRMHGAERLNPQTAPALQRLVMSLADRADVALPTLYYIPSVEANAMAVSTSVGGSGALAVTDGALRSLKPDELEGVLAHEIAHLKAKDTSLLRLTGLVSQAVVTLLRLSLWIAIFTVLFTEPQPGRIFLLLFLVVTVPAIIGVLFASLARTRELAADAVAVGLTGKPWALAAALTKIHRRSRWLISLAGGPQLPSILRSHPSTSERVRRLNDLTAAHMGDMQQQVSFHTAWWPDVFR